MFKTPVPQGGLSVSDSIGKWQASGISSRICRPRWALGAVLALAAVTGLQRQALAEVVPCDGGNLPTAGLRTTLGSTDVRQPADSQPDLLVTGVCLVQPGTYYYRNINVVQPAGALVFPEAPAGAPADQKLTTLWARTILIEAGGAMLAGAGTYTDPSTKQPVTLTPFGSNGGELDIVLFGTDQSPSTTTTPPQPGPPGVSVACASPATDASGAALADCGVPQTIWNTNGSDPTLVLPGGVTDRFYQYGAMFLDGVADPTSGRLGHFSYKSIGLGYGGTLQLSGYKGTSLADDTKLDDSGSSWVRLAANLKPGDTVLTLDRNVAATSGLSDWQVGDEIVVTTTDYIPSHSEQLKIAAIVAPNQVQVETGVQYAHVGQRYDLSAAMQNASSTFQTAMTSTDIDPNDPSAPHPSLLQSAETRAGVALLRRSIRIMSGGDRANETFDDATNGNAAKGIPTGNPNYQFGGQVIFRQGFQKLQIQGVEFHQLGVGGRFGHYPVHFHMDRQVPDGTYIKDSSVSESMTRWYVIHATQGVTLQRDVGWASIGHGYYLEDGVETDNKLYSNIGIFARAAIAGPTNPRNIPGILAWNNADGPDPRVRSDARNPSIFWITNGWNDFIGNMAAGAGSCGACYWLHATQTNSDMVEVSTAASMSSPPGAHSAMPQSLGASLHQTWTGYSARPGAESPLRTFFRNYCSTAMLSFMTVSDAPSSCDMVALPYDGPDAAKMRQIASIAPQPNIGQPDQDMYYPNVSGTRAPTVCQPGQASCDVATANRCDNGAPATCGTTVIDHYTSSFHYAQTNFSAVWLRTPGWFLYDHSFLSDVQSGGLSAVSGGDYTQSSAPTGLWSMASHSVFVGATQPQKADPAYSPYADERGPHYPVDATHAQGGIACIVDGPLCINPDAGVGYFLTSWATGQRMFSIYDGPAYEDANAYINIHISDCPAAQSGVSDCMYDGVLGVRKYTEGANQGQAYLPNAAIGWKQPNGFYYPPAFHSANLYFDGVDVRHYVISPVFLRGTYNTDMTTLQASFAGVGAGNTNAFTGYTDVDRQTVLNDDDGTLTGFASTLSINDDPFYGASIQAAECRSNIGIDPAHACAGQDQQTSSPPSARTSPYDYVSTVIYPECAANVFNPTACGTLNSMEFDGSTGAQYGRYLQMPMRGGDGAVWSRDCAGPYCFGVPIYRQYLTDGSAANTTREWQKWLAFGCASTPSLPVCNFPFERMSGSTTWQRDALTVNNGKYYIDTTRSPYQVTSAPGQPWGQHDDPALGLATDINAAYVECKFKVSTTTACQPRSVNVFQAGQTYYLFFVFATQQLKQTYQIYVGSGFDPSANVQGLLVNANDIAFQTQKFPLPGAFDAHLIDQTGNVNPAGDILEVNVDFSQITTINGQAYSFNPNPPGGRDETCRPQSFCSWQGSGCGCGLAANDPRVILNPSLKQVCTNVCSGWAIRQFDCPDAGCLGIAFTLPAGFQANGQYKRPPVQAFPADTSTWLTQFKSNTLPAGDCTYTSANTPGSSSCPVPNIADLNGLGP